LYNEFDKAHLAGFVNSPETPLDYTKKFYALPMIFANFIAKSYWIWIRKQLHKRMIE
jgi:hypothetical protein